MKKILILSVIIILVVALFIRLSDNRDYGVDSDRLVTKKTELPDSPSKNIDTSISQEDTAKLDNGPGVDNENEHNTLSLDIAKLSSSKQEQMLYRKGYVVSYNPTTKNPNWVAWHLTKEHSNGPWVRDGIPYMVDQDVVGKRQELEDWYDRDPIIEHGHMCPAADNKWDEKAMIQSFLLTNICPQNRDLNRGDWDYLENRCRGWARHFGDIYIVAGPIFFTENYKTIGANKVGVPDAFFKVLLCMNKKPKALGFIYPNESAHHKMPHYLHSVDEVEEITGIDFFFNLPDELEIEIESSSDISKW